MKHWEISGSDRWFGNRRLGVRDVERDNPPPEVRRGLYTAPADGPFRRLRWKRNKVDIACGFADLKSGKSSEAAVFAALPDKARIPVRVCVKRKDEEACGQSRKRPDRRAFRKGGKLREKTAAFNERITDVTPLPNSVAADEVLETYRLRRRAGIHFKRLKPIPDFGGLPKKNPAASESRPNGKIMVALKNM
ncbi:MAG: hypothetical protein LBB48_07345 [Treponema sp.]|jgi:hypothetical protein|nr:hypothetical protein [Treponema sp.]